MVAITARGTCLAWGAGYYGRLGVGSSSNMYTPTKVKFPSAVTVVDVAVGEFHSMAISSDGDLWLWGKKAAICMENNYLSPGLFLQLEGPEGVPKVKSIACAGGHSFAVTTDGRVSPLWIRSEIVEGGNSQSLNESTGDAMPWAASLQEFSSEHGRAILGQWILARRKRLHHSNANEGEKLRRARQLSMGFSASSPSQVPPQQNEFHAPNESIHALRPRSLQLYAWGDNAKYQLGCGKRAAQNLDRPQMVEEVPGPVEVIATGPSYSLAVLG